MRPVFEVPLPVAGDALIDQIRRRLRDPTARVEGVMLAAGAELTTVKAEQHFWSPYLSVEVARGDDGAWALCGRFAPEPNVWILFLGIYGILGMVGLGALMYGLSQWMVRRVAVGARGRARGPGAGGVHLRSGLHRAGARGGGDVPAALLRRRLRRGRAASPRRERRPGLSEELEARPTDA
jgi:hypothetical protein